MLVGNIITDHAVGLRLLAYCTPLLFLKLQYSRCNSIRNTQVLSFHYLYKPLPLLFLPEMLCKRIKTPPSWIIPTEYLNTVLAQAEIRAEQFPPERKNFWA